MSAQRHATVSAWQREEDGSYKAEIHGWELVVHWRPEAPRHHRGFYWEAKKEGGPRLRARELHEEIEVAMAEAEAEAEAADGHAGGPAPAAH